jgi:hypothetical protein
MPDGGRLPSSQSDDAWHTETLRMFDDSRSHQQTSKISLFFDGTNNNDESRHDR